MLSLLKIKYENFNDKIARFSFKVGYTETVVDFTSSFNEMYVNV